MVHTLKWSKKVYRDGSMWLTLGSKFIAMHKSMGRYWVDYGVGGRNYTDGNLLGTLAPARTKATALKRIEEAKREFIVMKERR